MDNAIKERKRLMWAGIISGLALMISVMTRIIFFFLRNIECGTFLDVLKALVPTVTKHINYICIWIILVSIITNIVIKKSKNYTIQGLALGIIAATLAFIFRQLLLKTWILNGLAVIFDALALGNIILVVHRLYTRLLKQTRLRVISLIGLIIVYIMCTIAILKDIGFLLASTLIETLITYIKGLIM